MPELPEVETIRFGISDLVTNRFISKVLVHGNPKLRLPISPELHSRLYNNRFYSVERRGKYLILHARGGSLVIHFGMTGRLLVLSKTHPKFKHEHVTIIFDDGSSLRFIDSRRFGAILWVDEDVNQHPIIARLGVEPLCDEFHEDWFFATTRKRKVAIKQLLMDGNLVVGVGNIYANEALFLAGIRPERAAASLSWEECVSLVAKIKEVLADAIAQGGTTIRDYANSAGKPGYFQQKLKVYGRGGQECTCCGTVLREIRLGQRTTVYCPKCQA